jgi:deferrochelatase/peroxidase EfeB
MFFAEPGAENGGGLDAFVRRVTGAAWSAAFDVQRRLETADLGGIEPFGFSDGISQPVIDWPGERSLGRAQLDYGNIITLGEVLLGYRNEYQKYTDRPLLPDGAATAGLMPADDAPNVRDLGRNGTYLVMRQLRQDVRAFWQFISRHAGSDPAMVERLSAAFVGRTTAGEPLMPIQQRSIPGVGATSDDARMNQFTFDDDPKGARCPLGAHIRRTNPRNADYPGRPTGLARLVATFGLGRQGFRDDLTSSVRFHRVVRRGREYGPHLPPADALRPAPADDPERGLQFVCLNANISRQFEFLQNAWVMNTKFSGLTGASDPLLGNREPIPGSPATSDFSLGEPGAPSRRVTGLPQFVAVRGGAYFFLPSLRALRFFAAER